MVTTRPPRTIVKPTALGPVANTDTKLLIYGLFQKGRVLAQDGVVGNRYRETSEFQGLAQSDLSHLIAAASYCFAVFFAFSAALASRTFAFSAALALASRTFSHARTSRRRN